VTPDPIAALPEADRVRRGETCRRPGGAQHAVMPSNRWLVACSSRRWPRRRDPLSCPALLPNDGSLLLRRRADPDPGRSRRANGVGDRVCRRNLLICRDIRRRLRLGPGRRRVRLRDGRRRRGSRRCVGRRRRSGRFRCGRRLGRGRRVGSTTRRKELERVDVRLGVTDPNTEVHVWHWMLRFSRRTGLRQHVPLRDGLAATDVQLPEMRQRRLVLARHDRDGQAVCRDRAGERHRAGYGRAERGSGAEPDVDATMLPGCVLVAADGEPAQYRAVRGPGPCPGGGADGERADHRGRESREQSRCLGSEHETTVATADAGDNAKLTTCYRERR
jgi:hypothetical protein